MDKIVGETVVVHTRDDASIRGVLTAVHADVYVLEHAAYLREEGDEVPIDGEALVPVTRVAFMQHVDAVEAKAGPAGDRPLHHKCGNTTHPAILTPPPRPVAEIRGGGLNGGRKTLGTETGNSATGR